MVRDLSETWLRKIESGEEAAFQARAWTEDEKTILHTCISKLNSLVQFEEDDERYFLTETGEHVAEGQEPNYVEGDFDPEDLITVSRHWYQSIKWDFDE